jgi:uncharacterized protein YlxP (DUF503 family)
MIYGVLQVDIRIEGTHSLKDKRSLLRKQIEKIRNAFHISVNEVGDHDLLGNATLGIAVVGSDAVQVESVLQSVLRMIDENAQFEIYDSVTHIDRLT